MERTTDEKTLPTLEPSDDLFLVRRASLYSNDELPPCDGAFKIRVPMPTEKDPDRFFDEWAVRIPDILEFVRFVGEDCVVGVNAWGGHNSITIYDDYLE